MFYDEHCNVHKIIDVRKPSCSSFFFPSIDLFILKFNFILKIVLHSIYVSEFVCVKLILHIFHLFFSWLRLERMPLEIIEAYTHNWRCVRHGRWLNNEPTYTPIEHFHFIRARTGKHLKCCKSERTNERTNSFLIDCSQCN